MCVKDVRTGEVLLAHRAHEVHRTASIGKLLLLQHVAHGLQDGSLDRTEPLDRRDVAPVADSGLWQHLEVDVLPLHDLAVLVAAVSDNLATNVLVHRVGLPPSYGTVALHDVVRDHRGPEHPPTLSTGTADGLVDLVADLHPQVQAWLRTSTDLSMVASAFALDPLAHAGADLLSKTGTDSTVRADVGRAGHLAYAVLAEWDGHDLAGEVLHGMRLIGEQIRDRLRAC